MSNKEQNSQSAQQDQVREKSELQEIQQEGEEATQVVEKNLGNLFGLENASPLGAIASGGHAAQISKQQVGQQLNSGVGIFEPSAGGSRKG